MNMFLFFLLVGAADFRIESQHFVIESRRDLKRLAESVMKTAEEQYESAKKMMPLTFSGKIIVRIADSMSEYESLQPKGMSAPRWSVGIAYPKRREIVLRGDSTHGPDEILRTFRHELAHIFLHNFSERQIPLWFSEGFSMYFEASGGLPRGIRLIRQALANEYIDIERLENALPDNPVDIHNAYLTASEFFSYLLSQIGEVGLYKVFEYLGEGNDIRYAIYMVSGKTLSEMERDFRRSARFRYAWLPVITSSTTLWILLTILFIYVFVVKRRRTELRLEAMRAEEERILLEGLESEEALEEQKRYLN